MSLNDNHQLFKKDILDEIVYTYHNSTDIRIEVIDSIGNVISSYGEKPNFCTFFTEQTNCKQCKQTHLKAAKLAVSFGDAYIFFCPAGLTHYVTPLLNNEIFCGALVAGPIMMEDPNELFIYDFIEKFNLDKDYKNTLMNYLREIPVVATTKVRHYSKLLFYTSVSLLQTHIEILHLNQERSKQQAIIGEAIHYSKSEQLPHYPYAKEKELYSKVRSGDTIAAKKLLNDILGHIFFSEGSNLNVIKSRIIELCSILSRAAVEGGASIDEIFKKNTHFINELSTADDLEELSFWLLKVLDVFTDNVLKISETKNKNLIETALHYIHQNFPSTISLDLVADKVHLNPNYFSTIFKKETGTSLTYYINDLRINSAKHLLTSTNKSILEIAISVGFEDQSYFCKVFRKFSGLSPTQYREIGA